MKVHLLRLASRMGLTMFVSAGAILLLVPPTGLAQNPGGPAGGPAPAQGSVPPGRSAPTGLIRIPAARAEFPQAALLLATHPAIKFVPFPMVQPGTKTPIAPTAILTLPNGRQVQAKAYYDQLNQYEEWLNERGQTLKQTQKTVVIELAKMPVDTQLMQRQIDASPKATALPIRPNLLQTNSFKALSVLQPIHIDPSALAELHLKPTGTAAELNATAAKINAAGIRGATLNHLVVSPQALGAIAGVWTHPLNARVVCQPINKSQSYNWNQGDPAKFNAYLSGSLTATGQACMPPNLSQWLVRNQSKFTVTADAKAGGYVYHVGGDVLRLTGTAGGDASTNTVNASFGAFVLGQSVYSVSQTANVTWGLDKTLSKSIDFSASTTVMVGPVPVNLSIGAQGSAGVDFSLNLYPTYLNGTISPFVNSSVYAQAGVSVIVASAGVGVSMVLENASVDLNEQVGIIWFFNYYLASDLYANVNLNMLDGNVYAYVQYYVPCWGLPPWCSVQHNANLYSWSGVHYNSTIFNDQNFIPLNW